MKTAYIVSTGTELLLGNTIDTNALFLSYELTALGVRVVGRSTVGDNQDMIKKAFRAGYKLADLVVSTGGLGPTADDLSREAVCEFLDRPLVFHDDEFGRIKDYFSRSQRTMPESNRKQAMFPAEAQIFINTVGTASGFMVSEGDKKIILLPGPPHEMKEMFKREVQPMLRDWLGQSGRVLVSKTVKVIGLGESQVESLISDVMSDPEGCSVVLLAESGEVHIRVTRDASSTDAAETVINSVLRRIREKLGDNIYGADEETLSGLVVSLLSRQGHTVALAESCTGGMVGKMLTDIPGSSASFWGGVMSYSNEAKTRILGVDEETLERYGAVSPETAKEMAREIRRLAGSTYGLSLTGIAGPEGGSAEKPVGLVYMGMATAEGEQVLELRLIGNRNRIRTLAAKSLLDWLRRTLEEK